MKNLIKVGQKINAIFAQDIIGSNTTGICILTEGLGISVATHGEDYDIYYAVSMFLIDNPKYIPVLKKAISAANLATKQQTKKKK